MVWDNLFVALHEVIAARSPRHLLSCVKGRAAISNIWGPVLLRDHVHSYLHPIQQVCGGGWPLGILDGGVTASWALVFDEAI
jgi:hypothetical protein